MWIFLISYIPYYFYFNDVFLTPCSLIYASYTPTIFSIIRLYSTSSKYNMFGIKIMLYGMYYYYYYYSLFRSALFRTKLLVKIFQVPRKWILFSVVHLPLFFIKLKLLKWELNTIITYQCVYVNVEKGERLSAPRRWWCFWRSAWKSLMSIRCGVQRDTCQMVYIAYLLPDIRRYM